MSSRPLPPEWYDGLSMMVALQASSISGSERLGLGTTHMPVMHVLPPICPMGQFHLRVGEIRASVVAADGFCRDGAL